METWRWGCGFGVHGNQIEVHGADDIWKNSYNVTPEELFDLFGKFGAIRYVYWKGSSNLGETCIKDLYWDGPARSWRTY